MSHKFKDIEIRPPKMNLEDRFIYCNYLINAIENLMVCVKTSNNGKIASVLGILKKELDLNINFTLGELKILDHYVAEGCYAKVRQWITEHL